MMIDRRNNGANVKVCMFSENFSINKQEKKEEKMKNTVIKN